MIDLGATVCTPTNPACDRCPLSAACSWRGGPGEDPAAVPPSKRQARFEGSDRQARGRLLDACRSGPVAEADVPDIIAPTTTRTGSSASSRAWSATVSSAATTG